MRAVLQGGPPLLATTTLHKVANGGWLTIGEGLELRRCCRGLRQVHKSVIYNTDLGYTQKWRLVCPPSQLLESGEEAPVAGDVEELIQMDVNRSLPLHGEVLPAAALRDFLLTYARQHPELPYCQGMNYIAGFILITTDCSPHSMSVFTHMMTQHF